MISANLPIKLMVFLSVITIEANYDAVAAVDLKNEKGFSATKFGSLFNSISSKIVILL